MASIDDLLVGLGFEYDPTDLKKFQAGVASTVQVTKQLAKAAIGAAAAITGITAVSAAATDEQGLLAAEIDDTAANVAALSHALQLAGGSSNQMGDALRDLSIRASEAAKGAGSGVEALGRLGISSVDASGKVKVASKLMLEISEAMVGLGKAEQIELADKLGLKNTIRLLQQGPAAIRTMVDGFTELGAVTKKDVKVSNDFQNAQADLIAIFKSMSRVLTREVGPILTKVMVGFKEWWVLNRKIIEQDLPRWIEKLAFSFRILTVAVGALMAIGLLNTFAKLIGAMKALRIATIVQAVSFALMWAAAMIGPIAIGGAILALIIAIEDLWTALSGGESYFNEFANWLLSLEGVQAAFDKIFDKWNELKALVDGGIDFFKGGFGDAIFDSISGVFTDTVGRNNSIPAPRGGEGSGTTIVDKVEILIEGADKTADEILAAASNAYEQVSKTLRTAIDQ